MRIGNHIFTLSTLLCCLHPQVLLCDDGSGTFAAGALELSRTDTVAMKSERLIISPDKVSVEFEFRNESNKEEDLLVFFPLPVSSGSESMGAKAINPTDFSAEVDGKPVAYASEIRVFFAPIGVNVDRHGEERREVTKPLDDLGLLKSADMPPENLPQNEVIEGLIRLKILTREQIEAAKRFDESGKYLLRTIWTEFFEVHVKHYWHQKFPPKKVVRIRHTYNPSSGGSSNVPIEFGDGCRLQDAALNTLGSYRYVEYILRSANSWKNGIEQFELIVKGAPVAGVCMDEVNEAGFGEMRIRRNNFKPAKDLFAYFVYDGSFEWGLVPAGHDLRRKVRSSTPLSDTPGSNTSKKELPTCETVRILEYRDGFYKVESKSGEGWIPAEKVLSKFNAQAECKDVRGDIPRS